MQREPDGVRGPSAAPLNLLHLAKADPNAPRGVPGSDLSVRALAAPLHLAPASLWLLVLEGELIADLPHGDFRVLRVGDSLRLGAEKAVLTPLEGAVFLFRDLQP